MRRPPRRSWTREEDGTPSASAGFLAAVPLFAAYEVGLALATHPARASAERVVCRVLFLFEGRLQLARVALLLVLAVLAWVHARRPGGALEEEARRRLARLVGVGVVAGMVLGPLLVALQAWLGVSAPALAPEPARTLASSARLVGSAPWEELLFRVGFYGAAFLLVRRTSSFLGLQSHAARFGAELLALGASAVAFAWFHLESVQGILGARGEPFDLELFLWRVSAGILLGGLFRWRGFAAAAWAHATFNLGIALGIPAWPG